MPPSVTLPRSRCGHRTGWPQWCSCRSRFRPPARQSCPAGWSGTHRAGWCAPSRSQKRHAPAQGCCRPGRRSFRHLQAPGREQPEDLLSRSRAIHGNVEVAAQQAQGQEEIRRQQEDGQGAGQAELALGKGRCRADDAKTRTAVGIRSIRVTLFSCMVSTFIVILRNRSAWAFISSCFQPSA